MDGAPLKDGFEVTKRTVRTCDGQQFAKQIATKKERIRKSEMFQELKASLEPWRAKIDKIRCLALGSFHDEFAAGYQFALLDEIREFLENSQQEQGTIKVKVSIFDPAFTSEDEKYISELGPEWSIDGETPWEVGSEQKNDDTGNILFFLPHAPLDLTEAVIISDQPRFWLANNIVQHTDRYTKQRLFEKYPVLSKLLNYVSSAKDEQVNNDNFTAKDGEFVQFVSRRNRRKAKQKRFQEPQIDYDAIPAYFKDFKIVCDFMNGKQLQGREWLNSFSDLAFQLIE
ncbi:LAMI_0A01772g1_1 [Lachancea mirantina]|uniref:LAMI_0A01772g1_1 n=1 Tax=Lachancea mirantina TaxID=1230905 RepID=A0A1G4IM22_9SACH|nr:LAMI_0A01772g1_1 [Lachancea mirantina]